MGNKAQAVGSVEYTKQGGTYFIKMVSDFGDIRQKYASYNVNTNEASGIVPDFTNPVQQPTIEAYITNSKKGAEVYPNNAKWTANGVELTFGEDGISTQNFAERPDTSSISPLTRKRRQEPDLKYSRILSFHSMRLRYLSSSLEPLPMAITLRKYQVLTLFLSWKVPRMV